jgi:hypothetical protein
MDLRGVYIDALLESLILSLLGAGIGWLVALGLIGLIKEVELQDLTGTPHAFGNQHRREGEGPLGAVAGEELDFLYAPKLNPRKSDPRSRFQVSRSFHRWTALDQERRSGEVERDLSRRPGDHAFVRDFAGQDSDVATLLNPVQRTVGKLELRRDLRISLQKTADQARDNGLSQIG